MPRGTLLSGLILGGGLLVLAFALAWPPPERSDFQFGFLFPIVRAGQALPLIGLGFVAARSTAPLAKAAVPIFMISVIVGLVAEDRLLAAVPGTVLLPSLFLIPPACCTAAGVLLLAPAEYLRAWLLVPAAVLFGIVLGLNVSLSNPTVSGKEFAAGALLAGIWLVLTPALLGRLCPPSVFAIAARIFGGWLIAIGLLLGALQLIPLPY